MGQLAFLCFYHKVDENNIEHLIEQAEEVLQNLNALGNGEGKWTTLEFKDKSYPLTKGWGADVKLPFSRHIIFSCFDLSNATSRPSGNQTTTEDDDWLTISVVFKEGSIEYDGDEYVNEQGFYKKEFLVFCRSFAKQFLKRLPEGQVFLENEYNDVDVRNGVICIEMNKEFDLKWVSYASMSEKKLTNYKNTSTNFVKVICVNNIVELIEPSHFEGMKN